MDERVIGQALETYSPTDAAIATLRKDYGALKIAGVDDKEGFDQVHTARMHVRDLRVGIEKRRKELKADALEYGRRIDGEAKRLTALLTPIETLLKEQEDWVAEEKERKKREAEEARRAVLRERMRQLRELGSDLLAPEVEVLSDDEFAKALKHAQEQHEKRERAKAEEQARRKAEQERLAEERRKLDAERKQLEAL